MDDVDQGAPFSAEDAADVAGSVYTGRENLEVMKHAYQYNRLLLKWISSYAAGASQIVDFGAGAGVFAIPLVEAGHRVLCVEVDPLFKSMLREHGLPVAASLDVVPDSSIDFIYAFDVLEHIEDDVHCLELWHRKLRPGGRILVYVPAFPVLYSSMDRHIGHYRRYRLRSLRVKCRAAGFAVDRAVYVDCIGFLASLAYKLTDRGAGVISWRAVRWYDRYVFRLSRTFDLLVSRWVGKNLLISARRAQSA
ncbi:MAG: class I SAM-dependent methyltransferase [Candidatus Dormibacteria bacterium]